MKKAITAVTTIFIVGFFAVSAYAWGCGYGPGAGNRGYGKGFNNQPAVNQKDLDAFYKDTQALRTSLCADRAELNALMAGPNPDPQKARVLSEKISKTRNAPRAKARQHNISGPMGGHGYGPGGGNCGGRYRHHAARCW